MKRLVALLLTLFIVTHAPWRLLGVGIEMFVVHPGTPHFSTGHAAYWDAQRLEARLDSLNWNVQYIPSLTIDGEPVYGLTVPDAHLIAVDAKLSWDARFTVLAHEAGHALQPYWMTQTSGDCYAEGVAVLLAHDGLREHARYLATRRWSCAFTFLELWPSMYHSAATLRD